MSKEKQILIYLADLDHYFPGNRISVPLGIGSIKSYCVSQFGDKVKIELFKNPEELMREVKKVPPDILGCSFYMWNTNLTLKVLECCKKLSPSTITVIGGPNVSRISDRYKKLLQKNPSLDVVVIDQGEKSFANVVERRLNGEFFSKEIPGCAIRVNGSIIRGKLVDDFSGLNKIPSPYLIGYLDKFIKLGYLLTFETVRGCPHSCTYCGGGDKFVSKLIVKDEEMVYKELQYLLKNSKGKDLDLTDTNFGLFGERDLRIIKYIQKLYKKHNFPFIAGFATTKDQRKTTVEILKIIGDITGFLSFGVQTLTPKVLKNCKRKNVDFDMMKRLIDMSRRSNISVHVDVIFGLPEETKESFIETVSKLRSIGVESLEMYQLRLLHGTQIAEIEREKYKYKTKFRPINNRFGEYELLPGEKPVRVIEVEEIAVGSDSFDFEDYMVIRELGFMTTLLTGYGTFTDTIAYLLTKNVNIIDIIQYIQQNKDSYPMLVELFKEYREYSEKELKDSEEDFTEKLVNDDNQWNKLMSSGSDYFKINIGFVGHCMFHNVKLLDNIAELITEYADQKLKDKEMKTLSEILKHDRIQWVIQDKIEGKLKPSDVQENIPFDEYYDYEKWKIDGAIGNLEDYKLGSPVQKIYYVKKYDDFLKTIENLNELSSYIFYERVITQGQIISMKRFGKEL